MKQLLSLFLFLVPCLALAQYPSNGNQKITLGEQTTADGLIYRGVIGDTALITPLSDTSAYIILDTANQRFYNYNRATNVWSVAGGVTTFSAGTTGLTPSTASSGAVTLAGTLAVANGGTGSATQNFVDLTNTQTVGGAKTFNGNITINNLNPSGLLKYGGAIASPESGWNELPGVWAIGATYPNARFYVGTTGGSYGITFFQARNGTSGTPLAFYSSYNLIQGRTGIGFILSADTTAYLTIVGGDATYPSLIIKSGTLTSSAKSGAIENNGSNLFFSPSTTRHTVNHGLTGSATLDFPSTTTLLSADLTITVTGAADGDVISLGVPNAAVNANTSYSAWVSAANTVTVRFNNYSSGTVNPASALFKVFVTK
jgi:hypothetical protein